MGQYFRLPGVSVSAAEASVGLNGDTAPTSSTQIGGVDGTGDLVPVSVDSNGAMNVSVVDSALPTGAATAARQDTGNTSLASIDTKTPALVSGRVPVDGSGVTQPISAAALPLPAGAATDAQLIAIEADLVVTNARLGATTETAPATDTAVSGLNGRLQRIAQRLTSLIGLFPSSIGQKNMAGSLSVAVASDQSAIPTIQPSVVSTQNSSTTPLAANGVFTGTSEAVQDYASISVSVFSNVASATLGLSVQQSQDGTNWDFTDPYTVPAGSGVIFSASPAARFCRVVYTNGGTIQATFRLQTIFHYATPRSTTRGLADTITLQSDAELVIAQLRATNGLNTIALNCDSSGNLGTNISTINSATPLMGQGPTGTGSLRITPAVTNSSAVTSVAASASSVSILASNNNRSGAAFYNDSSAICYLKLGTTASTTSYTVQMAAGSYYELPTIRCYVGAVDAIWASATGSLRITELS